MKVLIDFSPIKSGGGAQLAINFLKLFNGDFDYDILVSNSFPYDLSKLNLKARVIVVQSSVIKRVFFENFTYKSFVLKNKYTHIYTFFGAGLPKVKGIKQVTGVAYPIICNDDSQYWSLLPFTFKLKKKIVNSIRKARLKTADHIIFETEVMQRRCIETLGFDLNNTTVIPPTPSAFIKHSVVKRASDSVSFLILSGLDYHKNIWRLIQVLELLDNAHLKVKFIISAERTSFIKLYDKYINEKTMLLIDKYFDFRGYISSDKIQSVYDESSVVLNIADLESFSNNYMEAWVSKKPILASKRDFAIHICNESAIYVEPHDPISLFNGIKSFACHDVDIGNMIEAGQNNLKKLPIFEERVSRIIKVLAE